MNGLVTFFHDTVALAAIYPGCILCIALGSRLDFELTLPVGELGLEAVDPTLLKCDGGAHGCHFLV